MLNEFTRTAGQWFDLVQGMSSGQFAVLNLPTFYGVTLEPEYNAPGHAGFSLWAAGTTWTSVSSSSGYCYPTSAPGQMVTFTASIYSESESGGTATGNVTFKDGDTVLGTVDLDGNGRASLATSALPLGTDTVTAT